MFLTQTWQKSISPEVHNLILHHFHTSRSSVFSILALEHNQGRHCHPWWGLSKLRTCLLGLSQLYCTIYFVIKISLYVPMYMYPISIDNWLLAPSKSTITLYQACIFKLLVHSQYAIASNRNRYWHWQSPLGFWYSVSLLPSFTIFLTAMYIVFVSLFILYFAFVLVVECN